MMKRKEEVGAFAKQCDSLRKNYLVVSKIECAEFNFLNFYLKTRIVAINFKLTTLVYL